MSMVTMATDPNPNVNLDNMIDIFITSRKCELQSK